MKNLVHNEGNVSVISKKESLSTTAAGGGGGDGDGDDDTALISATPKKRALNKLRKSQNKNKYNAQNDDVAPTAIGTKAPTEPTSKMTDERNNNYDSKTANHKEENTNSNISSSSENNSTNTTNTNGSLNSSAQKSNGKPSESTENPSKIRGDDNDNDDDENHKTNETIVKSVNDQFNLAEAAKIWLKNGINGTTAAAFLTAFQLPGAVNALASTDAAIASAAFTAGLPLDTGASSKVEKLTTLPLTSPSPSPVAGGVLNCNRTPSRNNGLSPIRSSPSAHSKIATTNKSMAATITPRSSTNTTTGATGTGASPRSGRTNSEKESTEMAIDYTTTTSSSTTVTLATNGRLPATASPTGQSTSMGLNSNYGGRLQFFKDGKFILELACSKEAGKGGWISVPRKTFRFPTAATSSSIVTPNSAIANYAKNECSMSMSLSDDNSSIQSSPWQRDHNWKQTTPRCGISKEMVLYYKKPSQFKRSMLAIRIGRKKTRRPYDSKELSCKFVELFKESHDAEEKQEKSTKETDENEIKIEKDLDCSSSVSSDRTTITPEDELDSKDEIDKKKADAKNDSTKSNDVAKSEKSNEITVKENNDDDSNAMDTLERENDLETKFDEKFKNNVISEDDKNATCEAMNTSEDDEIVVNDAIVVDTEKDEVKIKEEEETTQEEEKERESRKTPTPSKPCEEVKKLQDCDDDKDDDERSDGVGISEQKTKSPKKDEVKETSKDKNSGSRIPKEDEEGENLKRLKTKTPKLRAKLNTVIQKLIDTMPTRLIHLSKTPTHNSSRNSNTFLANKFSPPSSSSSSTASSTTSSSVGMSTLSTTSATALRLVDYHHQHVSPRKRILREFEKVSLEDNTSAAGGKRSRAKNSTTNSSISFSSSSASASTSSSTLNHLDTKSSHTINRQSDASVSNGGDPSHHQLQQQQQQHIQRQQSPYQSQAHSHHSTTETEGIKTTNTKVSTASSRGAHSATTVNSSNSTPTRLYSSYSIHSLLSGTSSSPSSGQTSKKTNESQSSAFSDVGISHHQSHQQQHHQHHNQLQYNYNEVSHNRSLMLSPKSSTESQGAGVGVGGGKSPSNSGTKRRSPPYASPLRESHSRSPTVAHHNSNLDHNNGQYSPHGNSSSSSSSDLAIARSRSVKDSFSGFSTSSGFSQYGKHFQAASAGAIYSPFMTSPKYAAPPSNSSGFSTPPQHSVRSSPRHSISSISHSSSTSSTSPAPGQAQTANVTATSSSIYIPVSQSTSSAHHQQHDLSPQRSLAGSPQRESTPRTVPKKTASIRKQFASPSTSASNSTNNSCPSPSERGGMAAEETHNNNEQRKLATSTTSHITTAAATHPTSALHHGVPGAPAYYMYPPTSLNGNAPSEAHALLQHGPMTAYIPPMLTPSYYNSYLALTNKYYFGSAMPPPTASTSAAAVAAAAAAARLSPSFPPMSIPYNGVNPAAMAAAAAAAAYGAQANMAHSSLLAGSQAATMAALYGVGLGLGGGAGGHSASSSVYKSPEISHNLSAATASADPGLLHRSLSSTSTGTTSSLSSSSKSAHSLSAVPKMNNSSNNTNSMYTEAAPTTGQHYTTSTYENNNAKDEHSSDFPLNLSKR